MRLSAQAGNDSQWLFFFFSFTRAGCCSRAPVLPVSFPDQFLQKRWQIDPIGRCAQTSLANEKAARLLTAPQLTLPPAHWKTTSEEAGLKTEPHRLTDTAISLFTPPGSLRLVQCSAAGEDYF